MSRIGKMPINVPAGVTVTIAEGNLVTAKGPKGEAKLQIHPNMIIAQEGAVITVSRPNDEKENRSLHGLSRTLLNNMIVGVNEGYKKELEIIGVGYRCAKDGKKLTLNVGYSNPVVIEEKEGISIEAPAPNKIIISGVDKQAVGQFAAEVRKVRPPEPYKGKGIRYVGEYVRRKEGKTGAKKK